VAVSSREEIIADVTTRVAAKERSFFLPIDDIVAGFQRACQKVCAHKNSAPSYVNSTMAIAFTLPELTKVDAAIAELVVCKSSMRGPSSPIK
jgi:hypothetical protein